MQDMTAFTGLLGTTANEFATEIPEGRDYGFLWNATDWTYPATADAGTTKAEA